MIVVNCRFLTQKITGSQRFAIEISKQLKKMNHDILFVAPKNIIHKDIAQELNVKIIGNNTGHFWEQVDLPLYLRKIGNPLLVNLVNTAPLFYKNKVVTIHDLSWMHFPDYVSKKFYMYYLFLIPKIAKNSLHILTVSEFSKKDISNKLKINDNKISVIYNAHNRNFKKIALKKEYIVLSVVTLHPLKNIARLIESFIILKKLGKIDNRYNLVIIGTENKKIFSGGKKLLEICKGRDDIFFKGYVKDVSRLAEWYNKAKVFVFPSLFESFGIPPLEAMACGTPVIVSNAASLPEVCGNAAYYVDPYDVEDIAKGIETVLKDDKLQKELIKKGLERVKMFSWEKSAKKLIEIIKEVS